MPLVFTGCMEAIGSNAALARIIKNRATPGSSAAAFVEEALASAVPQDRVKLSPDEDFQAKRLKAAIEELVQRHPEPSAQRDPVLLRVLGRECRNSEEMEQFRPLLFSEDSKCLENLHYFNGVAPSKHPHNGKTFNELAEHLDLVEPVLDVIRELAEPLPEEYQSLARRTSPEHHAKETADGKFDYQELYAGGFVEKHITGFYASDNPETITDFGDTQQSLKLSPDSKFISELFGTPADVNIALEVLGLDGNQPVYEMYNKAGIDVCLYKELPQGGSWFTIYNPEAIESVS